MEHDKGVCSTFSTLYAFYKFVWKRRREKRNNSSYLSLPMGPPFDFMLYTVAVEAITHLTCIYIYIRRSQKKYSNPSFFGGFYLNGNNWSERESFCRRIYVEWCIVILNTCWSIKYIPYPGPFHLSALLTFRISRNRSLPTATLSQRGPRTTCAHANSLVYYPSGVPQNTSPDAVCK